VAWGLVRPVLRVACASNRSEPDRSSDVGNYHRPDRPDMRWSRVSRARTEGRELFLLWGKACVVSVCL
jgi:hypothetical protein